MTEWEEQSSSPQYGGFVTDATVAWWYPLWEFLIHVLVGTGIFVLIAAPAIGLNLLVASLATLKVGFWIILGLEVAEYGLFIVDIVLYLVFLVRTAWRTAQKL